MADTAHPPIAEKDGLMPVLVRAAGQCLGFMVPVLVLALTLALLGPSFRVPNLKADMLWLVLAPLTALTPVLVAAWLERQDEGIWQPWRRWLPMRRHGWMLVLWTYSLLALASVVFAASTWLSFAVANQVFGSRRFLSIGFVLASAAVQIGGVWVLVYGAVQRVYRFPPDHRRSLYAGPVLALVAVTATWTAMRVLWGRYWVGSVVQLDELIQPGVWPRLLEALLIGGAFGVALSVMLLALWVAMARINRAGIPLAELHAGSRRRFARRDREVF